MIEQQATRQKAEQKELVNEQVDQGESVRRTAKSKRIAFFGFYGRDNFGDDLFGYILQSICNRVANVEIMLVGASPQREITTAWRLPAIGRLWQLNGAVGAATRFVNYCAALTRADAAVFGGGSLFGADASVAFARFIVNCCALLKKPVYAVGVSVGPFATDDRKRIFTEIVGNLTALAVRDTASVANVTTMVSRPVPTNLGDLAYSLPYVYSPRPRPTDRRTLVVSVHLFEYLEQVLAVLKTADLNGWVDDIVLLSLDRESVIVAEEIRRRFSPQNLSIQCFAYRGSVLEVIDLLSSASCVVTSKLHGAITSYVYNVPSLLFCYQKKCSDFLLDNGLPGLQEKSPSADACVRLVDDLLHERCESAMFTSASTHFDNFKNFLTLVRDGTSGSNSATEDSVEMQPG